MDYEALTGIGSIALGGGLLATICFYFTCRTASFVPYFGIAALVGVGGYVIGTAAGIYFACSSPSSGNLCGLYGVFGVGPLVSGLALLLFGPAWRLVRGR